MCKLTKVCKFTRLCQQTILFFKKWSKIIKDDQKWYKHYFPEFLKLPLVKSDMKMRFFALPDPRNLHFDEFLTNLFSFSHFFQKCPNRTKLCMVVPLHISYRSPKHPLKRFMSKMSSFWRFFWFRITNSYEILTGRGFYSILWKNDESAKKQNLNGSWVLYITLLKFATAWGLQALSEKKKVKIWVQTTRLINGRKFRPTIFSADVRTFSYGTSQNVSHRTISKSSFFLTCT